MHGSENTLCNFVHAYYLSGDLPGVDKRHPFHLATFSMAKQERAASNQRFPYYHQMQKLDDEPMGMGMQELPRVLLQYVIAYAHKVGGG